MPRPVSILENVVAVELLTQVQATAARGQKRRVAMLAERAKTKTRGGSAKGSLGPLSVVWVQARELLETRTDQRVEGLQGGSSGLDGGYIVG